MQFLKLPPKVWSQDTLLVPNAGARQRMPPVEYANSYVTGRESFFMSTTFTVANATPIGTPIVVIIPTDQDGDFWCQNIYTTTWIRVNPQINLNLPGTMQLEDIRTGKQLGYPTGFPTLFAENKYRDANEAPPDDAGPLGGLRPTATLPEAFCFTRQGGIKLTFIVQATSGPGVPIEVWFAFGGWKEYAHASGN